MNQHPPLQLPPLFRGESKNKLMDSFIQSPNKTLTSRNAYGKPQQHFFPLSTDASPMYIPQSSKPNFTEPSIMEGRNISPPPLKSHNNFSLTQRRNPLIKPIFNAGMQVLNDNQYPNAFNKQNSISQNPNSPYPFPLQKSPNFPANDPSKAGIFQEDQSFMKRKLQNILASPPTRVQNLANNLPKIDLEKQENMFIPPSLQHLQKHSRFKSTSSLLNQSQREPQYPHSPVVIMSPQYQRLYINDRRIDENELQMFALPNGEAAKLSKQVLTQQIEELKQQVGKLQEENKEQKLQADNYKKKLRLKEKKNEPIIPRPKISPRKATPPKKIEIPKKTVRIINMKAQSKLRCLLWTLVYPVLLRKQVEKDINAKKKAINDQASSYVKDQVNAVSKFIKKHCFSAFESLYELDSSLSLVQEAKKGKAAKLLNKASLIKRSKLITTHLTAILSELQTAVLCINLPESFIQFLLSISENKCLIPTGFFFPFEISRLEATAFLSLKNMNPMRSKMVIGMFFLVRMVVFYFLTQPWAAKIQIEETPYLKENLKVCSSILYRIILDYFRKNLPVLQTNVNMKKIKPHDGPLFTFDETPRPIEKSEHDEVILGLHSADDLKSYFEIEKTSVENMTLSVEELLETLYLKIHPPKP